MLCCVLCCVCVVCVSVWGGLVHTYLCMYVVLNLIILSLDILHGDMVEAYVSAYSTYSARLCIRSHLQLTASMWLLLRL